MFIVFGSPRSGTTLLKETLNLHPDIFIPMQTTFISTAAHVIGSVSSWDYAARILADLAANSDDYAGAFGAALSRDEVRSAVIGAQPGLASVLDALYGEMARKLGKRICGDKSPDDLLSIRKLEQVGLLTSDVKVIHIVRDVRGSLASLLNVDWAPAGIDEYFPRIWSYTNLHLFRAMSGQPNYLMLTYESLVSEPQPIIEKLVGLLGLDFVPEMLESERRGLELRTNPSHLNLARPFLLDRANAWRSTLTPEQIRHCESSAHEALRVFGYI
ncbi:Sulfotransferase family protein [Caballeronia arationis]|uniref:Sulfotransferase family protein n=1 Tax=Caballeronia arationis TaxID=1777142 RepID=A0A7Z7N3J4_9BURK|nr:sulfotransferase [Caballeronia arationis]SOE80815.1 Sulfotransferase family protein [Caballeronia arationis]